MAIKNREPRGYFIYYAGLRIGEIATLDVGDAQISARKGQLVVRHGKGGRYREVPLRPELRTAPDEWLKARAKWGGADGPALRREPRAVQLWDLVDPAAPRPLGQPMTAHTSVVWSVVFSPDGRNLASASADQTLRLWDARGPRPSQRVRPTDLGTLHTERHLPRPVQGRLDMRVRSSTR